jgi:predicted enzyme related to lactoylglutathione lyase
MDIKLDYVIVGVKALEPAVAFYRDVMGFQFLFSEPEMHFASFKVGAMSFSLAEGAEETTAPATATPASASWCRSRRRACRACRQGVFFSMGPGKMPWGGYMAMFKDPDGNEFYLNQAE